MAGGGKPGGAAAASKPGGFLKKVKEEKAKEEVQEKAAKAETKKEPFKEEVSKEDPKKFSAGDSLIPERRGLSYSGRRSPALSGRRSPMSRAEARKYSTPDPRVVITFVWFVLCCRSPFNIALSKREYRWAISSFLLTAFFFGLNLILFATRYYTSIRST